MISPTPPFYSHQILYLQCIFITPQAARIAIIVVFIAPCVASSPARVQRAFLSPRLGHASPRGRVHRRDLAVGRNPAPPWTIETL